MTSGGGAMVLVGALLGCLAAHARAESVAGFAVEFGLDTKLAGGLISALELPGQVWLVSCSLRMFVCSRGCSVGYAVWWGYCVVPETARIRA